MPVEAAVEGPLLVIVFEYLGLAFALPQVGTRTSTASTASSVRMILATQRIGSQRETLNFVEGRRCVGWQCLYILSNLYGIGGGVTALRAE